MGEHVSLSRPANRTVTKIPECTCTPGKPRIVMYGGAALNSTRADPDRAPVRDPNCPRHRGNQMAGKGGMRSKR